MGIEGLNFNKDKSKSEEIENSVNFSEGKISSNQTNPLEETQKRNEHHGDILKKYGIEILPEEKLACMNFGELKNYQLEIKNKIFEAQNSLNKEEDSKYRVIFDEALSKVDIVRNPTDLLRLRREYNLPENL